MNSHIPPKSMAAAGSRPSTKAQAEQRLPLGFSSAATVIVIDDDPDCLSEYSEAIRLLGYECVVAPSAQQALKAMNDDPSIGIIVTDLAMPGMDGLALLNEISSRFAPLRPLVAIVITGHGSLPHAVEAMRHNAVDFLTKPVTQSSLSASLRMASLRRTQIAGQQQLQLLAETTGSDQPKETPTPASDEATTEKFYQHARQIMLARQRRGDFLEPALFSEPAWDMLLDLTLAKLEGKAVPVSSACAASGVPFTTALRYVKQLVDGGWVRRWKDPADHRRVLLELEDHALDAMRRYLDTVSHRLKI